MKNLMKALIGSGLFAVVVMLSACGSSNNDTTAQGLTTSSCSNATYGVLSYNATCSQYGNYGLATNGQCEPATTGTCTNTSVLSNTSGTLYNPQYGYLTQSAQCTQYGSNYGLASNGQCVQGTYTSTGVTGVNGTTGVTSCQQTGYVPTQIGCLPYNQGACQTGYTFSMNPYNGQPWCFPIL